MAVWVSDYDRMNGKHHTLVAISSGTFTICTHIQILAQNNN